MAQRRSWDFEPLSEVLSEGGEVSLCRLSLLLRGCHTKAL